jgi:flap endonuclease-1
MGVKISDIVSNAKKEITIQNLIGKKIAIDAFNSIYQFLATIRQQDGTPLTDLNGKVTSHLKGLFYRTLNLIENDIRPIYVFDGPPHELKLKTLQERKEIKEEQKKKMEEAIDSGDDAEAKKHAQGTSKLTAEMIEESKELLNYMGIPWIEAVHDGEAEAARLINEGTVWASASQDYDSMLFGAKRLIRNLNINRKKKVNNIEVDMEIEYYTLDAVLQELGLTRDQLIDLGILVGVDFFEGIKGIGEKTALKLIKEHGSIEKLIENKITVKNIPINLELDLVNKIRKIFREVEKPSTIPAIKWQPVNEGGLRELLIERHNFAANLLDTGIKRLIEKKSNKVQSSLDKFF